MLRGPPACGEEILDPPQALLAGRLGADRHDTELPVALLHRREHVARARQQLQGMVADLLVAGAEAGAIRSDIAPGELASYCLHALAAAGSLSSEAAVRRLLAVTMAGLRPQPAR